MRTKAPNRGKHRLLDLIEALRPLGLNASVSDVSRVLLPLARDRFALRITRSTLEHVVAEARHQALINRVVYDGCKREGYRKPYSAFYPEYLEACRHHGETPYSLSTFQKRAFEQRLRCERERG